MAGHSNRRPHPQRAKTPSETTLAVIHSFIHRRGHQPHVPTGPRAATCTALPGTALRTGRQRCALAGSRTHWQGALRTGRQHHALAGSTTHWQGALRTSRQNSALAGSTAHWHVNLSHRPRLLRRPAAHRTGMSI